MCDVIHGAEALEDEGGGGCALAELMLVTVEKILRPPQLGREPRKQQLAIRLKPPPAADDEADTVAS